MRIGVKLPHTGAVLAGPSSAAAVPELARRFESAGFDSLWVSDHLVLPGETTSWYPFAEDGVPTWPADTPYLEAVVALAAAAASTTRVRLGTAVLVLPQRNPVVLAKQLAGVAHLAGGRLDVGVGAGWLREEFDALDAPFADRGTRMVEWVAIMRACWTGKPAEFRGRYYQLPPDLRMMPTPPAPIPILVGGHSARALGRAGSVGDGWLGQQAAPALDPDLLAREIAVVRNAAAAVGRDPAVPRIVLRIVESAGRAAQVAKRLAELEQAGVDEVIVDVHPFDGDPIADHAVLRDAAQTIRTDGESA
jgi:probable F420-dependent oxidoreductase